MLRACLVVLLFASPAFAQQKGRKVAFLVGVGEFKHGLQNLDGMPQRDIRELGKVLSAGGFEVVVLTDRDASKDAVEKRFRDFLRGDGNPNRAVQKGDVLVVAACTHGFSIAPKAGGKEVPFLAAHDSRPDDSDTMVPLNRLIADASGSGAVSLLLVDACREVQDANRGIEGERTALQAGTAVLFSCGRGQVSHQSEKLGGGHGLFTYAVLRTLRGDTGLTGDVTLTDLVGGIHRVFRSEDYKGILASKRKPQTPVLAAGELGDVTLITLSPGGGGGGVKTDGVSKKVDVGDMSKKVEAPLRRAGELANRPPAKRQPDWPDVRDYFPLTQGSEWVYKVGNERVRVVVDGTERFDGHEWTVMKTYVGTELRASEYVRIANQTVLRGRVRAAAVVPPLPFLAAEDWTTGVETWGLLHKIDGQEVSGEFTARGGQVQVLGRARDAVFVNGDLQVAGAGTKVDVIYAKGVGVVRMKFEVGGVVNVLELESFTIK